jgi:molybdate transport system ATP-binding protein
MIDIRNLTVRLAGSVVLNQVSFSLHSGMCLAVCGPMGSGKTILLKALNGNLFHSGTIDFSEPRPQIGFISRQHFFTNRSNISSFYYQQRFNSFDADETRTVEEELLDLESDKQRIAEVLSRVGLANSTHSGLILLSNGEHKRFQIAKALLRKSNLLLLDAPFTGLDANARIMLNSLLTELRQQGMAILITTGSPEFPSVVTHTAFLHQGMLSPVTPVTHQVPIEWPASVLETEALKNIPTAYPEKAFTQAVSMKDVTIRYGDKIILDTIDWNVQKGECWNLRGHNGSGKSTLLSLIYGDNPQAFSQDIWLFDRKKGSGESIWDIKRHIGFISPELHHYMEAGSTAFDLIASGLFDTTGLFRTLNSQEVSIVRKWIDMLQMGRYANRYFGGLSDGEQRKILLTRALVKNPPLLLLDEPCQGLDEPAKQEFLQLIDSICRQFSKTLIYVSHYDAEIPVCVNRRITLDRGRVTERS